MPASRVSSLYWFSPPENLPTQPMGRWRDIKQLLNRTWTLLQRRYGSDKLGERSWQIMQQCRIMAESHGESMFFMWEYGYRYREPLGALMLTDWPMRVRLNRHAHRRRRQRGLQGRKPSRWDEGVAVVGSDPLNVVDPLHAVAVPQEAGSKTLVTKCRLWHFPEGTHTDVIMEWALKISKRHASTRHSQEAVGQPA